MPKLFQGVGTAYLTNKFGNIYANYIANPGETVVSDDKYQVFYNKDHYGTLGPKQSVGWSLDSQRNLNQAITQADDPKQINPTFLLRVGAKQTSSNNF
jgi:hypothetical protein